MENNEIKKIFQHHSSYIEINEDRLTEMLNTKTEYNSLTQEGKDRVVSMFKILANDHIFTNNMFSFGSGYFELGQHEMDAKYRKNTKIINF